MMLGMGYAKIQQSMEQFRPMRHVWVFVDCVDYNFSREPSAGSRFMSGGEQRKRETLSIQPSLSLCLTSERARKTRRVQEKGTQWNVANSLTRRREALFITHSLSAVREAREQGKVRGSDNNEHPESL